VWILAFAAAASPALLRALFLPPLGWDTLTYHAVKAGMWVQNSGADSMVGTGPWGYYRNMLAGGEIFTAWAMLPLRADTLTGAFEVLQWLALGLAVMALARQLRVREPFASTAAGFVLALPTVHLLPGSGYIELGLLLALASGLVLFLSGIAGRPGLLALAGAALGVSAAAKLPMVPLCGGLALLLAARVLFKGTPRARAAASAGLLAFAVALVPWLLLAHARAGSFFSPLPIQIGGWVLGEGTPEVRWMLERPVPSEHRFLVEAAGLAWIFHAPFSRNEALGLLALVPLAAAPLGFRSLLRRARLGALSVGIVASVTVLTYYSPDFATGRYYWAPSSSRFLLPMVMVAVVAGTAWCRADSARARGYVTVLRAIALLHLLLYMVYGFSAVSYVGVGVALCGLLVLGAAASAARRLKPAALRLVAMAVLGMAAVLSLAALRDALRDRLLETDFVFHKTPRYWADAVQVVDRPDGGSTIAVTSGPQQSLDNWFASPFMGRRLQNRILYVPVSRDGAIRNFGGGGANEELTRTADFDAWCRRLRERGVSEVMSFEPPSLELSWMERRADVFDRLAGADGRWGLFRLRGPG
jgi:hypothetical protein